MSVSLFRTRRNRGLRHLLNQRIAAYVSSLARQHNATRKHRMAVFANDEIGVYINQFGFYEKEQLEILFSFLEPLKDVLAAGTALDIGANIGNHTVYFSSHFKSIHSFEPNPNTFELLALNTRGLEIVTAHNIGLGDEKGAFQLGLDASNVGGASIRSSANSKNDIVSIRVETLDGLDADLSGLCFIKMDVEGYEPNVIRGATETLQRRQPLIVLEQHAGEFKNGKSEAISLLQDSGYKFCWHQNGSASTNLFVRRLHNIKDIFTGRVHRIVSDSTVPVNTYPMLIAVPPRFHAALKLSQA